MDYYTTIPTPVYRLLHFNSFNSSSSLWRTRLQFSSSLWTTRVLSSLVQGGLNSSSCLWINRLHSSFSLWTSRLTFLLQFMDQQTNISPPVYRQLHSIPPSVYGGLDYNSYSSLWTTRLQFILQLWTTRLQFILQFMDYQTTIHPPIMD